MRSKASSRGISARLLLVVVLAVITEALAVIMGPMSLPWRLDDSLTRRRFDSVIVCSMASEGAESRRVLPPSLSVCPVRPGNRGSLFLLAAAVGDSGIGTGAGEAKEDEGDGDGEGDAKPSLDLCVRFGSLGSRCFNTTWRCFNLSATTAEVVPGGGCREEQQQVTDTRCEASAPMLANYAVLRLEQK
mmetsp:Transcript_45493/g.97494  ORF Transcript_45493/g.97494 Transcript_45493/m.97494 type:complete len:188 (-) Transcript_45493:252-815(-)